MGSRRSGKTGKTGKSGKPETPEDEDALLWKRIAESTKPLPGRAVRSAAPGPAQREPEPKKSGPAQTSRSAPPRAAPPQAPELRPGEARGLDRRSADRLRRGQFPVEARIDLHGQTREGAHRALAAFIAASHKAGRRCVLVITGKGGPPGARGRDSEEGGIMPDRERGVLRREVPRWLNEPDLRPLVLGLAQAQPAHGGAGAFYVLLKRQR